MASKQLSLNAYFSSGGSDESSSQLDTCTSSPVDSPVDDSSDEESTSDISIPATKRRCQTKDTTDAGHHRKSGVDPAWKTEFRWLEFVRQDEQVGLLCKICAKYNKTPRNGRGSWTKVPCFTLRKDKIKRHENSRMHKAAISLEADRAGGGIAQAFSGLITCEMKAAVGCCKCIYWLCKNEIPHTTVYPNLLELAEQLGCEYFKALKVGRNATYTFLKL